VTDIDTSDPRRQYTILVVEDESAVRDVVAQMLVARNFRVLVAADGHEALRLLQDHAVDLMLTDIMMPGLSGYELALRARGLRPSVRILYTTGNDERAAGRDAALSYGKVIGKPLHARDLVREIRRALAQ
jgi:CheY-like chemotaxis protein